MKFYEAGTTIHATPDAIWRILTDAPGYSAWDSGVVRVGGRIAPGKRSLSFPGPIQRACPVTVSQFVPGQRMVWSGGMPLGLFKGVRAYTLTRRNRA